MIDILIPVLGRPTNAAKVTESVKVTKEPYRLLFICSPSDREEIEACRKTDADVLVTDWHPGKADFAKKINWAFSQTDSEWVFQGADDLSFHQGWDHAALLMARGHHRRVVGTNDLHNPAVRRRIASTHTLFARSYIEEYGGTEDDTGTVFCELYDHQYVDTEFVNVARRRNEWIFCRNSVVEHLHPHWGLAEMDATYRKAIRATGADTRLYRQRNPYMLTSRAQRTLERQIARQERKEARQR